MWLTLGCKISGQACFRYLRPMSLRSLKVFSAADSSVRTIATTSALTNDFSMPDSPGTMEKYELVAKQTGNDNPFDVYTLRPEAGLGLSSKHPILIPSVSASRMIGCCCEDDYKEVIWFNLDKSSGVQKCDCGVHFKLIDYDPLDPRIKPRFGMGFGSGMSTFYY